MYDVLVTYFVHWKRVSSYTIKAYLILCTDRELLIYCVHYKRGCLIQCNVGRCLTVSIRALTAL